MKFTRRNVLRGAAGLSLALPWLEATAQSSTPPRRLATVFTANGDVIAQRFTKKGETDWVFADMLTPFEPYRSQLLVLDMVNKHHDKLPAGHVADGHQQGGSALAPWQSGSGSFPLGGTCDSNGQNCQYIGYVLGPSIDCALGDRILKDNPSIPQRHLNFRVGGQGNDIWNLHSHAGPVGTQSPVNPETSPFSAYTRIFANIGGGADAGQQQNQELARRLAMKKSALDLLKGELSRLQGKVSADDRARLDQHATSLRDIERQLESMADGGTNAASCGPLSLGSTINVFDDANHAKVGQLFIKIIAMSFACDLVRTCNFSWSGNTNNRAYTNLGISQGHHDISHMSDTASYDKIRQIKKHLFGQSVLLHEELKKLPEAGKTVWDNSVVMHWSELSQGDTHSKSQDLVILAGGAGGYFRMGRMLDLTGKKQRGLSNLLISLWNYMGYNDADTQKWGEPLLMPDGPGPMPNLV